MLFSSFDKHSLQKIRSQHLVQINLVVDLMNHEDAIELLHYFVALFCCIII